MDGIPAVDLLHSSVRGNSLRSNDSVQGHVRHVTCHKQSKGRMNQERPSSEGLCLEEVDYVLPDVSPAKPLCCASLRTMRHAYGTQRVELEWLFDRFNFDPMIQVKYGDTKSQLANILTKGSLTHDRWDILFLLQAHSRIDEGKRIDGKVMSKCHMQAKERGEEASHRVVDARVVRNLAVLPKSLRSPQDGGSSSSVAPNTGRFVVLASNDETTHQSQEAQCDGTTERSPRQVEAQCLTNLGSKFRYTTVQAAKRTRCISKTWRNWRQTWCSSFPSQWSHVEDLHDFLHVGDSAP